MADVEREKHVNAPDRNPDPITGEPGRTPWGRASARR